MALYFFLLITIGLQLGCAYPSIPEEQRQCIVDWYPKNDRPLYGKTQRMTGPCESFNVKCSYGITLSLNVPEGLGFLGTVVQGCPDRKSMLPFLPPTPVCVVPERRLWVLLLTKIAFLRKKNKNKEFGLAVPCCLPDIKCGSNLAGRCMNRNKPCNDGAWFRFVHT